MLQNNMPKVCICIPTYNSSLTIAETVESILNQTYTNLNILIVDNASTDNTIEIVKSFASKDNRIKIFRFDENVGGEGNFTRCIQLADGEYTAIYHSDDIYFNEIIEKQIEFLEADKNVGAVFSSAIYIDKAGKQTGTHKFPPELIMREENSFDFSEIFKLVLKYGNFLVCPSAMVRTNIYKNEICIWDGKKFASSADLDVWLRILNKHFIGIINQSLMKYRVSISSFSYHYARSRIQRSDMFLVLEYYMTRYRSLLDSYDYANYQFLLLLDDMTIIKNLIIQDKRKEALEVIMRVYNKIKINVFKKKNFMLLLKTIIFHLICFKPINKLGRKLLSGYS